MEAKKSKKAAIENHRGSWLLMGLIVALAFMFVSFEWTQHDVSVATASNDESIFVTELPPITIPKEKLELPPPPKAPVVDKLVIVENDANVANAVNAASESTNEPYEIGTCAPKLIEEEVYEEPIIDVAEFMPEFPGGTSALMSYLSKHIKYPAISQEMNVQGRVIVQFVVDKDGSISNPTVVRGGDAYLDKEALRVISGMPKWSPGVQNGKKVRVKYTVPVMFRLQ